MIQEWNRLAIYATRRPDGIVTRISIDMAEVTAVAESLHGVEDGGSYKAIEVFFRSGSSVVLVADYADFVRDWYNSH